MGDASHRTAEMAAIAGRAKTLAQEMKATAAQLAAHFRPSDFRDPEGLRGVWSDLLCAAQILDRLGAGYDPEPQTGDADDLAWWRAAEALRDLGEAMVRRLGADRIR